MSQALRDLPDPLLPPPALPSSSPDDLLAKMADEAIDELMAAADKGEAFKSAPMVFPSQMAVADAAAVEDAPAAAPFVDATTTTADDRVVAPLADVDATAGVKAIDPDAATATAAIPSPAAAAEAEHSADGQATDDAPTGHAPAAVAATPDVPAADVRTLLQEETPRPSPLLLPLRIINAPFDWLGDRGRTFVGLLGIVTLIPAACAVIYVLFMRGR